MLLLWALSPARPWKGRESIDLESGALTSGLALGFLLPFSPPGSGLQQTRRKQSLTLNSCQISFSLTLAPLLELCLPPGMLGFHTFPLSSKQPGLSISLESWGTLGKAACFGKGPRKKTVTDTQGDRIPQQTQELGVVTHTCNSRPWEAGFPGWPWLPSEVEASLSYLKPCPSQVLGRWLSE